MGGHCQHVLELILGPFGLCVPSLFSAGLSKLKWQMKWCDRGTCPCWASSLILCHGSLGIFSKKQTLVKEHWLIWFVLAGAWKELRRDSLRKAMCDGGWGTLRLHFLEFLSLCQCVPLGEQWNVHNSLGLLLFRRVRRKSSFLFWGSEWRQEPSCISQPCCWAGGVCAVPHIPFFPRVWTLPHSTPQIWELQSQVRLNLFPLFPPFFQLLFPVPPEGRILLFGPCCCYCVIKRNPFKLCGWVLPSWLALRDWVCETWNVRHSMFPFCFRTCSHVWEKPSAAFPNLQRIPGICGKGWRVRKWKNRIKHNSSGWKTGRASCGTSRIPMALALSCSGSDGLGAALIFLQVEPDLPAWGVTQPFLLPQCKCCYIL